MDTTNKRSTTENVPLVVISPNGTTYIQGSLRQCASFFSELFLRITGGRQRFFDHKLIRNRIDFDGGEFSGPLKGLKIIEFPDFPSLRSYLWDLDGIPSTRDTDQTEPLKDRSTEERKNGNTEELNNRIQIGPNDSPNLTPDWSQIGSHTQTSTEVGSPSSTEATPRNAGTTLTREEIDLLFADI